MWVCLGVGVTEVIIIARSSVGICFIYFFSLHPLSLGSSHFVIIQI